MLERAAQTGLRRVAVGSEQVAMAFTLDQRRMDGRETPLTPLRLSHEQSDAARVLAARVALRIAPDTSIGLAFAEGPEGLSAQLQGRERPAFSRASAELEMSSRELMGRLVFLVGSAVILATVCRKVIGEVRLKTRAEVLDGAAVVTLIIFAIAIMDGLASRLIAEPGFVLFVIALSFMVYTGLLIVMMTVLAITVPQWGRRLKLSVGLASGARNLGVILAVMPANADPNMLLYFAAGQFPIYIMPAVLRPIMLRLVGWKTT